MLAALRERDAGEAQLRAADISADTLERLADKGWIEPGEPGAPSSVAQVSSPEGPQSSGAAAALPELTADQRGVLAAIEAERASGFRAYLLHGRHRQRQDRGLLAADRERARGEPPDAAARARDRPHAAARRAACASASAQSSRVLHSALTERERFDAWRRAYRRRSARRRRHALGGVRTAAGGGARHRRRGARLLLQAADGLSLLRARPRGRARAAARTSPWCSRSATPSLESIHNADQGRYRKLELPRRIGTAGAPQAQDRRPQPARKPASAVDAARRRDRAITSRPAIRCCCS